MQEPLPVNLAKIVSGRLFINFKRLLISFDCFSKIGSKSFPLSFSLISSVSKFRSKFNLVEKKQALFASKVSQSMDAGSHTYLKLKK